MLEPKQNGILSMNVQQLANRADDLKIIIILQNAMFLLMLVSVLANKGNTCEDMTKL